MSFGNPQLQEWQDPQSPPQQDLPARLSRTSFLMIRATTATRIRSATIVPMLSLSHSSILHHFSAGHFICATALALSVVASLYFFTKSIYIIPTRTAIANINPIIFTLPVNRPPNWLTMRAIT